MSASLQTRFIFWMVHCPGAAARSSTGAARAEAETRPARAAIANFILVVNVDYCFACVELVKVRIGEGARCYGIRCWNV